MNVVAYILSFCQRPERIIEDNIELLREIYHKTEYETEDSGSETDDSEDSDYEPEKDRGDVDESSGDDEEIIIKKDSKGNYYIY